MTVSCPKYTDELGHVDDVPLDPTSEVTYTVLEALLGEIAQVFPDAYLHLGGDEVKYGCWNESESIKMVS
jgi:N-acetyl-beta-hexosaminidase